MNQSARPLVSRNLAQGLASLDEARSSWGVFLFLAVLPLVSACSATTDEPNAVDSASGGGAGTASNGGSSGSEDGGGSGEATSGSAGSAGTEAACDTTKTPTEEACLLSNDYAVFLSPTGADRSDGSMTAPVATLSQAIHRAAGKKIVVVCNATYDEHVVVAEAAHVFGGFSCTATNWTADAGVPLFMPSTPGPALTINSVETEVIVDSVNFEVPDARQPGQTALAAFVNGSPNVTFHNVTLTAGAGADGANGTVVNFTYPNPSVLNGNSESLGGAAKSCSCQTGLASTGGAGGYSGATLGTAGMAGTPNHGAGLGGYPDFGTCTKGGTGTDGGDAPRGLLGDGATALGTVTDTGWSPANGADGGIGDPGQGGGGGASLSSLARGGGGACGACGGNGGSGGQGGGGSIALLAVSSAVTLIDCTLTSKAAGNGGSGHAGQIGQQLSGMGGGTSSTADSCPGGNGGRGGDGGASGAGAGGISIGIAWKGTSAPTLHGTTIVTGKPGAKGAGSIPGTNDGIRGVESDQLLVD
jgi:hypothetical protein